MKQPIMSLEALKNCWFPYKTIRKEKNSSKYSTLVLELFLLEGSILWSQPVSYYQSIQFEIFTIVLTCCLLYTSIHWSQLSFPSLLFMFSRFLIFVINLSGALNGLAVRIPGFLPGGLGSTPGMGTRFLVYKLCFSFFWVCIKHWG